jgi:Gpi18-like mannosyltransferase
MENDSNAAGRHGIWRLAVQKEWLYLLASVLIQLTVGTFLGHAYDDRLSMATGYLVASGQDPYTAQNLTTVFNNPAFQAMTSIGYPPPWPLILGIIYQISYPLTHNLLVYNLAIKLPIIAANLCLAYLVRNILKNQGASPAIAEKAWIFVLFSPFLIYFTSAWGQFDSLVALLTLLSLLLLSKQRIVASAVILGVAIAFKPTPVPVVLAALAYLWESRPKMFAYLFALLLSLILLCIVPFFIFHWSASPILKGWNAQFSVSGGMSLTSAYELIKDTYILPGYWWVLGFLWFPATLVAAFFLPRGAHSLVELIKNSLMLILVFFLTRTWLSETNITLILPLVLILVMLGELPNLSLRAVWVLPLIFTFFNTSPAQLLFPSLPGIMASVLQWVQPFQTIRLWILTLLVIPWQVTGWWIVAHRSGKKMAALV